MISSSLKWPLEKLLTIVRCIVNSICLCKDHTAHCKYWMKNRINGPRLSLLSLAVFGLNTCYNHSHCCCCDNQGIIVNMLLWFFLFFLPYVSSCCHFLSIYVPNMHWIYFFDRSDSSFLNLGGRVVMRRTGAAWWCLLICQNLDE